MNPDPKIEDQLEDDIAIQGATEGDEANVPEEEDADEADDGEAMEEVQEEAAEERKEGGYQ